MKTEIKSHSLFALPSNGGAARAVIAAEWPHPSAVFLGSFATRGDAEEAEKAWLTERAEEAADPAGYAAAGALLAGCGAS